MTVAYYLTSEEYTNLRNVSFCSEAPTEKVQESLQKGGFKMTLNKLMEDLNSQGYKTENRKK